LNFKDWQLKKGGIAMARCEFPDPEKNMQRVKVGLFTCLIMILLASLGAAANNPTGQRRFEANLSGNEEVPPVQTKARGEAKFRFSKEGDNLTYTLNLSNIKDVTAAHIQKGKKGENGLPIINLFTEPKKEDVTGTLYAEGKVEPYLLIGPLKGKSVDSLIQLMQSEEAYVNIKTKKHPDGEIRGQIKSVRP
jgi:hypothetical protein